MNDYDELRQTFEALLKNKRPIGRKDSDTSQVTVSNPPKPPIASLGLIHMTKIPASNDEQQKSNQQSKASNIRPVTPESFLSEVSAPKIQLLQTSIQDDNDKKRFKNHQHQIVAKLAMNGYLQYNEVIKIHELVDQDNKNIIYSFEVFAITKDKDDFSQTLRLIATIFYRPDFQQVSSSQDSGDQRRSPSLSQLHCSKGAVSSKSSGGAGPSNGAAVKRGAGVPMDDGQDHDSKDSNSQILKQLILQFNLSPTEEEKFFLLLKNKNKSLFGALSLYQATNDQDQLKQTVQVLIAGIRSSKNRCQ